MFENSLIGNDNSSGTSLDGPGNPLEQSCPSVGYLKTTSILLTINNHLLFDVQTAYSSTRERRFIRVYKQKHKEPPLSERQLTTFSKFANISKFKVSLMLCHLAKLLHHSHMSKFTIFIYAIKLVTRHECILFTLGSSCVGHWCTGLNFPI